tara:strand:- start:216 stop:416 length:201 start_codon:yes stop_codon:yes gene_type:complete
MKFFVFFYIIFLSKYAYAYLDFSFLTLIIQSTIAFFIGIIITLNIYWKNFKDLIKKIFKKTKNNDK